MPRSGPQAHILQQWIHKCLLISQLAQIPSPPWLQQPPPRGLFPPHSRHFHGQAVMLPMCFYSFNQVATVRSQEKQEYFLCLSTTDHVWLCRREKIFVDVHQVKVKPLHQGGLLGNFMTHPLYHHVFADACVLINFTFASSMAQLARAVLLLHLGQVHQQILQVLRKTPEPYPHSHIRFLHPIAYAISMQPKSDLPPHHLSLHLMISLAWKNQIAPSQSIPSANLYGLSSSSWVASLEQIELS